MKAKMLSLLAGVAMFGAVSAASAAETVALTEEQLDGVTAAFLVGGNIIGSGNLVPVILGSGNIGNLGGIIDN